MADMYRQLCPELQLIVKSYFRPYERHGIQTKRIRQWSRRWCVSPPPLHPYYDEIRYCPKGWFMNSKKTQFYYRRQNHYLQWIIERKLSLSQKNENVWSVYGRVQFDQDTFLHTETTSLFQFIERECQKWTHPPETFVYWGDFPECEACLVVSRYPFSDHSPPQSGQAFFVYLTSMVKVLSETTDGFWKTLKKQRRLTS